MKVRQASPKDLPVLRVTDLVRTFGERRVLDGVSLEVYPGETVVVMGPSGCGKSTLLRHMIGSLEPDSGRIELFGRNLSALSGERLDVVRKRIGVLFQSGALFNSMTVADNVALPLREHTHLDEETIEIIVKIKLEMVGLRDAAGLRPAEISGGMKKRAGLARAIALDPDMLFYDEPSAGLDPITLAQIDRLISDLARKLGVASLVVTHEMDSAFRIADRMAMLEGGRMLLVAPRERFERLRDGAADDHPRADQIRQFLRGDAEGPLTPTSIKSGYYEDILQSSGPHGAER